MLPYLIWDISKSDIACNTTTLRENELNRIIQKFWLFPVQNIKVKSEIKMTKWQKKMRICKCFYKLGFYAVVLCAAITDHCCSTLIWYLIPDHTQYMNSLHPDNEISAQYIYSLFFHMSVISAFIWNTMHTLSSAGWNGKRYSILTVSKKKHWGHAPSGILREPEGSMLMAASGWWLVLLIQSPSKITDYDVFLNVGISACASHKHS